MLLLFYSLYPYQVEQFIEIICWILDSQIKEILFPVKYLCIMISVVSYKITFK